MDFKMSWAMAGEHMDEWTGAGFGQAAHALRERVGSAVEASGMTPEAQEHFRQSFIVPTQKAICTEGYEALRAGHGWTKAVGPLLVALDPAMKPAIS
ncbi:hypothetical protein OG436_14310 [Streptomyces caniferus]|uniref:hypothetical protein n=1 Tax=Streptomyces caniferus TaxID=285557 RepID=UPI002E2DD131|nr:hypothetical protein [Streptomyces caniferus]